MKTIIIIAMALALSGCGFITPEGRANMAANKQCLALIPKPPEAQTGGLGLIGALVSFEIAMQNPVVQQYYAELDQCVARAKAEILAQ